jgi:putative membrane protein insertion efficiency factor
MKKISVYFIRLYQKYLSKGTCMYVPSCSEYTLEAIEKHGFIVGWFFGIKRIFRCTPWCKGGFDKVPDKKKDVKWVF